MHTSNPYAPRGRRAQPFSNTSVQFKAEAQANAGPSLVHAHRSCGMCQAMAGTGPGAIVRACPDRASAPCPHPARRVARPAAGRPGQPPPPRGDRPASAPRASAAAPRRGADAASRDRPRQRRRAAAPSAAARRERRSAGAVAPRRAAPRRAAPRRAGAPPRGCSGAGAARVRAQAGARPLSRAAAFAARLLASCTQRRRAGRGRWMPLDPKPCGPGLRAAKRGHQVSICRAAPPGKRGCRRPPPRPAPAAAARRAARGRYGAAAFFLQTAQMGWSGQVKQHECLTTKTSPEVVWGDSRFSEGFKSWESFPQGSS